MTSATIIIPWRDQGCPHRRANLTTTRAHVEDLGWPVILADSPGDWNLSAARNTGVSQATTDIVVIMDADILIPLDRLTTAVEQAATTGHVVHPYDVVEYQGRQGSITRRLPLSPGPCTILRRDAYHAIHGYDEGYIGWGYEDRDFDHRATHLGIDWTPGPATHQWHPSDKRIQSAQFQANKARYHAHLGQPAAPDVVYRVRPGDDNDELRLSLRSLTNITHGKVWIVGHKPAWVTGVGHLPGDRHTTKYANAFDGILRACLDPRISDTFILMDDDMMILQPVPTVTPWHYYPLEEHCAQAKQGHHHGPGWVTSLTTTLDYLRAQGCAHPISWEIHVPFLVERATAAPLLENAATYAQPIPPQARSVIANLTDRTGEWRQDVKIRPPHITFAPDLVSTDDRTIGKVITELRARFPKPSPWEATPSPARRASSDIAHRCAHHGCPKIITGDQTLCPMHIQDGT